MRNRSTTEALRSVLDSFASDLHVALPGVVRSYDAATQTADIEPGVQRVRSAADEEQDEDTAEALPVLPSVPVAWPRAGGHFLHWPLAAGDTVLLVFSESDLSAWRESGGVVDPGIGLRHGLGGAVAVPGLNTRGNPNADADGTYGRVGREGGPFVEFRPTEIQVGGDRELAEHGDLAVHLAAIAAGLDALAARIAVLDSGVAIEVNYGAAARAGVLIGSPIATTITKGT